MVRVGLSWGSGVLVTQSGVVLTVAHLFRKSSAAQAAFAAASGEAVMHQNHAEDAGGAGKSNSSSSSSGLVAPQQPANTRYPGQQRLYPATPQQLTDPPAPDVSIRLTLPPSASDPSSSSSSSSWDVWVPAKVVYCFTGYLDLAVLQIQPQGFRDLRPSMLKPLQLVPERCDVTPGDDVYVIGHGLFGPRMGLGPAVTAGCAARVVAVPISGSSSSSSSSGAREGPGPQQLQQQQQWKPSMVISTAAVHSGASGGALVDAAGRLVGLVTSNARHVKGQTLPHMNFCISAAELRPVWDWAQQQQQQQKLLQGFDVHSVSGSRLWALQPYMHAAAVTSSL
jgi:S1-C subfamily serine protease